MSWAQRTDYYQQYSYSSFSHHVERKYHLSLTNATFLVKWVKGGHNMYMSIAQSNPDVPKSSDSDYKAY